MRARQALTLTATAATAALVLGIAGPAGAGSTSTVTLDPNPATSGDAVSITPNLDCPDYEVGQPEVQIDVTGPENDSFTVDTTYDEPSMRYSWTTSLTAGPAGVYTVQATCLYPDAPALTAQPRQQVISYIYQPATLQVVAAPTTTTSAAPTSTTAAPSTSTTTAPATGAAAVTAQPTYTG